jgi:anti-anti-sigma factor
LTAAPRETIICAVEQSAAAGGSRPRGGCVRDGKEHATTSGTIQADRQEGVWVVALHGEHDISTTPSLRDELARVYESGSSVVVDLTDVEFMDSTVLQGILYGRDFAEQESEHRLVLVVPEGGAARRLLSLTNLDRLIATYPTCAEAVAALAT